MRHCLLLAACLLGCFPQSGIGPVQTASATALVTFTLRLAGDRQQFRPGEAIPIQLEFSSPVKGRFVVDGATYDRSGRLMLDEFRIEPLENVRDPLIDYYAAQNGSIGGGLRGM